MTRARRVKLAILTQQISNYHAARFRSVVNACDGVAVIAAMNDSDFPELLNSEQINFECICLFDKQADYLAAVRGGCVWSRTQASLEILHPEVIAVAGWSFPESLSAIAWAHRNKARVVIMSDSQERDSPRKMLREFIKRRIVGACDAALVGGPQHGDYVIQLGMERDRVFYGYDAVDNEHFKEGAIRARANAALVRDMHGLPTHYLLATARFIPKKNLVNLIRAFARALKRTSDPFALVILGDGAGRNEVQDAVASAGLEGRVSMPGFKNYDVLPDFYGLAEAFVHISVVEQWGLVINEAAASGLPLVVSTSCGAAPVLVKAGVNGILVGPDAVDEIADALHRIMSSSKEARVTMGRESQRLVADWGVERFAVNLNAAIVAAGQYPRRHMTLVDKVLLQAVARRFHTAVS